MIRIEVRFDKDGDESVWIEVDGPTPAGVIEACLKVFGAVADNLSIRRNK